jgi:hypothetical protein
MLLAPTVAPARRSICSTEANWEARMSTKRVREIAVRVLFLGVVVAVFGIVMLATASGDDPTSIDCGGETMTPGTECGNYRDGWVSYEDAVRGQQESIASRQRSGPMVAVIGVVLAIGALVALASASGDGVPGSSTGRGPGRDASTSTPWWSDGDRS